MFKVMLVEDEPIIREGLKHYFDWETMQYNNIIEASNGLEGLSLARQEKPDLIITDIRMPLMNGLDMIEQLRADLPSSLFVILTGYSDFEYAQRAIKLGGITEFLVKPLQYENSLSAIERCTEQLHSRRKQEADMRIVEEKLSNSATSDEFLHTLLTDNNWKNSSFIQNIKLELYSFLPIIFSFFPISSSNNVHNKQTQIWLEQRIKKVLIKPHLIESDIHIVTHYWKNNLYCLVLVPNSLTIEWNTLIIDLKEALYELYHDHKQFVFATITQPEANIELVHTRYKSLEQKLYQRYFIDGHLFEVNHTAITASKKQLIQLEALEKKLILECLEQSVIETLPILKGQMLKQLRKATPEQLLAYMQEFMSITIRFGHKHHIPIDDIYSDRLFHLSFLDDHLTLEQLIDWLGDWIVKLNRDFIAFKQQDSGEAEDQLFHKIEEFILEHIDQDISLPMVAERFFYNPSYLSRLFKQRLNKNYSLFQAEVRIQYAKQCLAKPQNLVTDVCTMCGYRSYKHFVKTFKQITQMTPTEYRKRLGFS